MPVTVSVREMLPKIAQRISAMPIIKTPANAIQYTGGTIVIIFASVFVFFFFPFIAASTLRISISHT